MHILLPLCIMSDEGSAVAHRSRTLQFFFSLSYRTIKFTSSEKFIENALKVEDQASRLQNGAHVFYSATSLFAFCVNSFIKRLACVAPFSWPLLRLSSSILPSYIGGNLHHGIAERDKLIRSYFSIGLNYSEMPFYKSKVKKSNEIKILFRIQSFHPTNTDFIIRHSCLSQLHSFFFNWIQGFYF